MLENPKSRDVGSGEAERPPPKILADHLLHAPPDFGRSVTTRLPRLSDHPTSLICQNLEGRVISNRPKSGEGDALPPHLRHPWI